MTGLVFLFTAYPAGYFSSLRDTQGISLNGLTSLAIPTWKKLTFVCFHYLQT